MINDLLFTLLLMLEQLTALEFIAITSVLTFIIIILSRSDVPPPDSGKRRKRIMRGLDLFIRAVGRSRPTSGEQGGSDDTISAHKEAE